MCCFGAPSHMQAHTWPHTVHEAGKNTPEHPTAPSGASQKRCGLGIRQRQSPVLTLQPCSPSLQEMLDIMKSIYDMMGKYTYPAMREEAPREHVENFFQVSRACPGEAEPQHRASGCPKPGTVQEKTPHTGDEAGLCWSQGEKRPSWSCRVLGDGWGRGVLCPALMGPGQGVLGSPWGWGCPCHAPRAVLVCRKWTETRMAW